MKYSIPFLLMIFAMCSSNSQKTEDFKNTKWIYDFGNGHISYFLFKDIEYEFYDAESGDTIFGTYQVKKDTIYISQSYGSYDKEFSEESRHRTEKKEFQLIVKNNTEIGFIEKWDTRNQTWIDNFYFKKAN